MISESQKTALCNGYMTAIVHPLVGLEQAKIRHIIQMLYDAGEHDMTMRAISETLRAVYTLGVVATETPSGAALFGNPSDLEWDGD